MKASGCPVSHTDYTVPRPLFETYELLNAEREQGPFLWNDSRRRPFWMITEYEHVLEALQMPDVFSNEVISALSPEHTFDLLPQFLDPPEHTAMRRVLNRWFAPAAVRRLEPLVLSRCIELIEELRPVGGCDLVSDFAIRFPTDLFLATLNLPMSDGDVFLGHVENVFKSFAGRELEAAARSTDWIRDYFDRAITAREREPRDTEMDFISRLLVSELGGAPIPREDIITICYTAMLAGLDTTRSALGYIFHHLARDPDLRHRLTGEPSLWPKAVEEFVRLYPLVYMDGRLVTRDLDFHGVPMRKGDIVWLGLGTANHDPKKFAGPRTFDIDREHVNHHLSFGAGPHRCLGMHLARHELVIAVSEWHKRIPDYEIATTEQLYERGAQLSINRLPLRWEVLWEVLWVPCCPSTNPAAPGTGAATRRRRSCSAMTTRDS
ncbi:MAG: cytochrome P450 [Streptosporangiaceae bacterium]|nr:cytochrome P450 [Streptosporangiaceae bacterium]